VYRLCCRFSLGAVVDELPFKEVIHVQQEATSTPPRRPEQAHCLALTSLWQALPEENRLQTLQVLRRVLAQQLPASPPAKEVAHEQH
jgi:hypothetical protein